MQLSLMPSTACLRLTPSSARAAGARLALVAGGPARIAEIIAARPLQHIAAQRRHVADLRAGGQLQRLGDDGIVALHQPDGRAASAMRTKRAQMQAIARPTSIAPKLRREIVDVDQPSGRMTSSFIRSSSVVPPARNCAGAASAARGRQRPRSRPRRLARGYRRRRASALLHLRLWPA